MKVGVEPTICPKALSHCRLSTSKRLPRESIPRSNSEGKTYFKMARSGVEPKEPSTESEGTTPATTRTRYKSQMRFFFGVTFLTRFFSLSRSKIGVFHMSSNPAAVLGRQRLASRTKKQNGGGRTHDLPEGLQFTRSKKNICGVRTHDLQRDKLLGTVKCKTVVSLKKQYLRGSNPRSAAR